MFSRYLATRALIVLALIGGISSVGTTGLYSSSKVQQSKSSLVSASTPINPPVNDPGDIGSVLASPQCATQASRNCEISIMGALDKGRASLGFSNYQLPAGFYALSPDSQILLLVNQDRGSYGLQPILGELPSLNGYARAGAYDNSDPNVGANELLNGVDSVAVGSNWFGSTTPTNALLVFYIWMYDDGFGSSNLSCPEPGFPGCWMHRDNLLLGGGGANGVFMGVAQTSDASFAYSFALVLVAGTFASISTVPVEDSYSQLQNVLSTDGGSLPGGYWLVASDGGVFSFGDANFYGSMGGKPLNQPIVGMASTPDGKGYWLVASDGGVFSFGDANFYGSMGGTDLGEKVAAIDSSGPFGYQIVSNLGGVFSFGSEAYLGSAELYLLNRPIVGATYVS